MDDVWPINNGQTNSFVDSMYHSEFGIEDTTETSTYALYLDIL
jgi:hypothetical protein